MKKFTALLLALLMVLSLAPAALAGGAPQFSYTLQLTDGSGAPVSDPRMLSVGDVLNVEIELTRSDVSGAYDIFGIEFRLMTLGLQYNNDGTTLRSGTEVREMNYISGDSVGFAWYDMQQVGESIDNPKIVGSWSYTVVDPALVNITVPVALVYVTGNTDSQKPVGMASLQLDLDGGSLTGADVSGSYTAGTKVTLPGAEKAGFTFEGWSDGAHIYPAGSEFTVSGVATLTAMWKVVVSEYTFTLNLAGGTISGNDVSGEYSEGEVVTLPAATRSGYDFKGWSDGENIYPAGTDYTVSGSVTLTAVWEEKSGGSGGTVGPVVKPPQDDEEEEPETPAQGDSYDLGYNVEMLITDRHVNYIDGYEDGTIRPGNSITRAEVATIFYRLLREEYVEMYKSSRSVFNDVDPGAWYGTAVCTLANAGILNGYPDGGFHPQDNITRAELVTIIDRFSDAVGKEDVFSDIYGHWAYDSITTAARYGWVNGYPDGTFKPNASITRAEVFAVVNRLLGRHVESAEDLLPGMVTFKDNLDTSKWYYCDVQEAANYHDFVRKNNGKFEQWTKLLTNINY